MSETQLHTKAFAGLNLPQGYMLNGKISATVATNNLTVALKTLAGNDPSPSDPVYVRIGDTVRSVTAALSKTLNAATNWFNAGASELATNEIDYFVYLGYNATDGVTIGFSRFPGANSYGDFSTTTTNEKYCAISIITTAASTDYYELVGRFAATLSAGAGYTWSVPTFTADNLIQHPIYTTRWLTWTPTITSSGAMTLSSTTLNTRIYKLAYNTVEFSLAISTTAGGTASISIFATLPFTGLAGDPDYGFIGSSIIGDGASSMAVLHWNATSRSQIAIEKYNQANYSLSPLSTYGSVAQYRI